MMLIRGLSTCTVLHADRNVDDDDTPYDRQKGGINLFWSPFFFFAIKSNKVQAALLFLISPTLGSPADGGIV